MLHQMRQMGQAIMASLEGKNQTGGGGSSNHHCPNRHNRNGHPESRDIRRIAITHHNGLNDHEYHEITNSEDEAGLDSPQFDFGPSLMDEVFKELDMTPGAAGPAGDGNQDGLHHSDSSHNVKNEIKEMACKLAMAGGTRDGHKRKQATVKPISASDQQNLESAIAIAKEVASLSMLELDGRNDGLGIHHETQSGESPKTPNSPNKSKNKFSFKFKTGGSSKCGRRTFSEEAEKIPDLQSFISDEMKEAYTSLIEKRVQNNQSQNGQNRIHNRSVDVQQKRNSASHDSSDGEQDAADSNPLRLLRNGATVIPKVRGNKQRVGSVAPLPPVSRPSIRTSLGTPPPVPTPASDQNCSQNALPLPPRDRSSQQQQDRLKILQKHHQRKHPLLIPVGPTISEQNTHDGQNGNHLNDSSSATLVLNSFRPHGPILKQVSCPEPPASYMSSLTSGGPVDRKSSHYYPRFAPASADPLVPPPKPQRSYREESFESEVQAAIDKLYTSPTEEKAQTPSSSSPGVNQEKKPQVETPSHVLKKEDKLLNSDEVRIMQKVLVNEIQLGAEECVEILNQTEWDVHRAIKCIRLRQALEKHAIGLADVEWIDTLKKFNWNVRQARNYLLATTGLPEYTTEV